MNIKINIAELHYLLAHTPAEHNIMLTGHHGIGKSEILTCYFESQNMPVITLFLGQMSDPGDLIGLPDRKEGRTTFLPPYWFPEDDKQPIVLFLDEINRARPEVLQTIMDLALNRRLAGRDLPVGSRIIAAANEGEQYQLTDLDPALVSRFNILRFEPSVEEWTLWAKTAKVDHRVINFIQDQPLWLDGNPTLGDNFDTGLDKTPDRRAWKRVSDIIIGRNNLNETDGKIIASIVGTKASNLFVASLSQSKAVEAQTLLHDFNSVLPLLASLQLDQFAVLNEDLYQHLQTTTLKDESATQAAQNLTLYVDYLEAQQKGEVLANFAHFFVQDTYTQAAEFITQECMKVARKLMRLTASIR